MRKTILTSSRTTAGILAAFTQLGWVQAAKEAGEITDDTTVQTHHLVYGTVCKDTDELGADIEIVVSMVPSARFNLGYAIIALSVDGEPVETLPPHIWSTMRRDLKRILAEQAKAIAMPDQSAERLAEDRLMEAERQRLDSPLPITSADHPFDEAQASCIEISSILQGLDPTRSLELARVMYPALDALHAATEGDRLVLLSNAEARLLFNLIASQHV